MYGMSPQIYKTQEGRQSIQREISIENREKRRQRELKGEDKELSSARDLVVGFHRQGWYDVSKSKWGAVVERRVEWEAQRTEWRVRRCSERSPGSAQPYCNLHCWVISFRIRGSSQWQMPLAGKKRACEAEHGITFMTHNIHWFSLSEGACVKGIKTAMCTVQNAEKSIHGFKVIFGRGE